MPDGEFFPPVQYLPWWGLLGFVIIVAVIAWWVFIAVSTRKSRVPAPAAAPGPATANTVSVLRTRYLGLIDETRAAYARGELADRDAYHQLSILLRSYVEEREGTRTVTLTLKELRTTELKPLSDAVARLYPGAFSPDYTGTVAQAVDEARGLVASWR